MSDSTQTTTAVSHTDAAEALMQKIQEIRDSIPNLVVPASPDATRKLGGSAGVSHDFVEETVSATQMSNHLAVAGTLDVAQMRDLLAFAEAYAPVVSQAESLTRFLKHTVTAAKSRVGSQALMTYSLAQRLAKKPETAYLLSTVEAMRQKLGKKGRSKAQSQPTPEPAPVPATKQ